MTYIKKGYGFNVGYDFARAWADLPIELTDGYAKPGHVVGYIAGKPDSSLGFLRVARVYVHVQKSALSSEPKGGDK